MIAFTIIIVFLALLLTFLVLIQNSKGGGLASGFASGNQVMGAPKTADVLEKATWVLVGLIVLLSILAVGFGKSRALSSEDASQLAKPMQEAAESIELQSAPQDAAPAADFQEEAAE